MVGGDEPAEVADQVTAQLEAGMTAVKMDASRRIQPMPSLAEDNGIVERLTAAREVLGPSDFTPALMAGVSVVQPDVSQASGISELRRIAVLTETRGALLARHCPVGPIQA